MNPHDHIDDYVDGQLSPSERQEFESAMAADATLMTQVQAVEELKAEAAALPSTLTPSQDLWAGIEAEIGSSATDQDATAASSHSRPAGSRDASTADVPPPANRPLWPWIAAGAAGLAAAIALFAVAGLVIATQWPIGTDGTAEQALAAGHESLRKNDFDAAFASFDDANEAAPTDPDVATAMAYAHLLRGEFDLADQQLKHALSTAPAEAQAAIHLRRALVAQRSGDIEGVQTHGERSGLPAGLVLAAEVYLADAESHSAIPLLKRAASGSDAIVADTARSYLTYLNDTESGRAQLAEAVALWALGQRQESVETAYELLLFLPERTPNRDAELLLWAGRAVVSGEPVIAEDLLDSMASPPRGHAWRVQATRAMVSVADGHVDEALERFAMLESAGAPKDGLDDARLTAASLVQDSHIRGQLLAHVRGPGAALLLDDPSRLDERDTALAAYLRDR